MAVTAQADERPNAEDAHRVISAAVDADFYRAVYTDVPPHVSPFWHYRAQGWQEGRDPAPWFSVEAYLEANPDVAELGVEPLGHFLSVGRHEGRDVEPSRHAADYFSAIGWAPAPYGYRPHLVGAPSGRTSVADELEPPRVLPMPKAAQRAAVASEFDADFYLALNPDISAAGSDPLEHFLEAGWREGRDPNPRFSVRDYLDTYPDVAAVEGLNPFAHYVAYGRSEGRIARHELGFRYDVLARLKSVDERIAAAAATAAKVRSTAPALLREALAGVGAGGLHLTFSHDNYVETFGGVQSCVRREGARFAEMGVDHLHIFPAAPWPVVRPASQPGRLGVLRNGVYVGTAFASELRALLAELKFGARRTFAVHSLLGHDADETADLVEAAGVRDGFFWLHDFASLCAGVHLLRNDVEDCAAPPADSAACGVCVYGPHRGGHSEAHGRLFARLAPTIVAPSQTTLDFWQARGGPTGGVAAGAVVLPHATLRDRGPAPAVPANRPFRLAFAGMPSALKGWPIFRDLSLRFADDPRYEFVHLGGRQDPGSPATFHRTIVTAEEPLAMQAALEAAEADAVLVWPLCRETFSFVAYEAAAAGAAVVTGPDSGNVATFALEPGRGRVLSDEAALSAAFESGEILALARGVRDARLYDLAYSGMSGDLVAERRA